MARFNERGVSLIEVMVTLVILSTGILALTAMQRQFIQASVRIQARGDALTHAESQLAVLLAMPTAELSSDSGNLTVPGTATSWHLEWIVQTLASAPFQGQARVVQLTVSWTPLQGAPETLTVAGWRLLIDDREAPELF